VWHRVLHRYHCSYPIRSRVFFSYRLCFPVSTPRAKSEQPKYEKIAAIVCRAGLGGGSDLHASQCRSYHPRQGITTLPNLSRLVPFIDGLIEPDAVSPSRRVTVPVEKPLRRLFRLQSRYGRAPPLDRGSDHSRRCGIAHFYWPAILLYA